MPNAVHVREMEEALAAFPWMDPHTHLDASHLSARGLDDILLYHMCVSELYASGCPSSARVPEDRSEDEAERRIVEAIPWLPKVRNTAMAWGVRIILRDLYQWNDPVSESNWRALHQLIRDRAQDLAWPRDILRRSGIARTGTELWRGRDGAADDLFQYALEWAFFARTQWGQPDIPLYELERAWNASSPQTPIPVTFDRKSAPPPEKVIRSVDDVDEAVSHYCALIPYSRILATAQHVSTDIDYRPPSRDEFAAALRNRSHAGDAERDVYSSYILHRFLRELEAHGQDIVFQFSLGAESLPFESASRLSQRTIRQVADIVARYPKLRFMCFVSSRHANQSLCTLSRELPNLSLAGYWWHNFFPGAIRHVIEERLDMLPVNRQIGFFSDAYCAEWTYAKVVMVRRILAEVLADKVGLGQYTFDEAVSIARSVLYDSSCELLGMRPGANSGPSQ